MNLSNEEIWNAIDSLARMQYLSASRLAKKVSVQSTLFNKSYRKKNCRLSPKTLEKIIMRTGIDENIFKKLAKEKI